MFSSSSGCRVEAVSPVEEQAREIARSDGRAQANELDRTGAHKELTGAKSGLEKLPTRDEPGRDWQIPLVSGFLIRVMQKKRSAFRRSASELRKQYYSTTTKSGSPAQITRCVYVKPSTSTATQQPSRNTKYEFPINRKWFAPYRWTKNSFGCRPRLNTSL